jgi:hypothetical protein
MHFQYFCFIVFVLQVLKTFFLAVLIVGQIAGLTYGGRVQECQIVYFHPKYPKRGIILSGLRLENDGTYIL